jgi:hypothetical protein
MSSVLSTNAIYAAFLWELPAHLFELSSYPPSSGVNTVPDIWDASKALLEDILSDSLKFEE